LNFDPKEVFGSDEGQRIMEIRTLRESIYLHLKDAIIKQRMKPNEKLQEKEFARQFGVSTTPVREAFLRLHAEGYINLDAHRTATVKTMSMSDLAEIYQVISVLDGFAARLASKRMNAHAFKTLKNLTVKMEDFFTNDMLDGYLQLNAIIHSFIWKTAGSSYLQSILDNVQNQMLRYQKERLAFYSKPNILKKSMDAHRQILNAFRSPDGERIERIVRDHWNISGVMQE
jgi:DNA-binding GntR family transcriptional regulator